MLEYWRNPEATAKKYAGEFLLTGDLGIQDADGYFWYVSREDDVITTAGYRVGPSEIEHTLMKHPAVAMSAVVGIPDPIRTELIKAWIVLRPGFAPSDALAREIQDFVKVQLAAHEYPRFVQFAETSADDRDRQGAAAGVAGAGVKHRPRVVPAKAGPITPGPYGFAQQFNKDTNVSLDKNDTAYGSLACAGTTKCLYDAHYGVPIPSRFSASSIRCGGAIFTASGSPVSSRLFRLERIAGQP